MKKVTVIISKIDWESALAGITKSIRLFKESDLHHYFGDHPEKHIVRVEIGEIDRGQPEKKDKR